MLPYRIRPEAEADLNEIYWWYERQREGLGADFLLCFEECLKKPAATTISIRWFTRQCGGHGCGVFLTGYSTRLKRKPRLSSGFSTPGAIPIVGNRDNHHFVLVFAANCQFHKIAQ